ncbi:integrase core domain-containing protein [Actinomyces oris]|uniref:Integrase core domain-containing protein n=1 Tax=Actinomyces oris TaxID=544580 RepID=A0AAW9KM47_9ACTO|nr:integrase core domain-containing protein [Actinomyces oris]MEA1305772.1 integrase core domain-containing protein [Actinomyces oris]
MLGLQSFNATLKNERVHRMVYPTKDKAMNDIASWIDLRYNYVRLHSALGCRTPNEVERELLDLRRQPETQTSTARKTPSSLS